MNATAVGNPSAAPEAGPRRDGSFRRVNYRTLRRLGAAQGGGLFVALFILGTYFTVASQAFLTRSNILVILLQVSVLGIVAVPGAMLLLAGKVDLSVGSVAGLSAACFGQFDKIVGWPLWLSIAGALAVGALWGLMNGVLVAYLKFSPIIVTLGGYAAAAGVAQWITLDATRYGFGNAFAVLGNGLVLGISVPVVIFAGVFLVGAYCWYQTQIGRHLTAIGANTEAAQAVGVATRRLPCIIYVLSGLAAASGGLILTSQLDGASVQIGMGLELEVLTAILLGGVAFTGGRGSLWGTLAGILFIGVLDDGLTIINVGPYVADVFVGAALVVAAGFDVLYQRIERLPMEVIDTVPAPADNATNGQHDSQSTANMEMEPLEGSRNGPEPDRTTDRAAVPTRPASLVVRDVSKRYGPVAALRGVSLELRQGEVLALVGDNGAGKSTLVSIISGLTKPDTGEILMDGIVFSGHGARAARDLGVETVFQNLALVNTLSIVDNVYLGRELYRGGRVGRVLFNLDKRRMRKELGATFDRLGFKLPPVTAKAGALSGGQRQAVAVARAVLWQSKVVVMDEPVAALGVAQTEAVLSVVEGLREHGVATLLITHNMDQVVRVTDRVVVLRLGQKVADLDMRDGGVSKMQLVGLITGGMTAADL
jgi:ribose/xylose/arabinose/galactoside ABC-type transport system permease subunit/ABC-type branched-subunit amino acid transport system ATPase component